MSRDWNDQMNVIFDNLIKELIFDIEISSWLVCFLLYFAYLYHIRQASSSYFMLLWYVAKMNYVMLWNHTILLICIFPATTFQNGSIISLKFFICISSHDNWDYFSMLWYDMYTFFLSCSILLVYTSIRHCHNCHNYCLLRVEGLSH